MLAWFCGNRNTDWQFGRFPTRGQMPRVQSIDKEPAMDPLLNDPLKLQRLHDAAHLEAERLRREAVADFWRGADALLGTAATQALRAAERLRHRLARRLPVSA